MSARKRPHADLTDPSFPTVTTKPDQNLTSTTTNTTTVATRYAPSTPHAIRALQIRSGLKTRSALRSTRRRAFGDALNTNGQVKTTGTNTDHRGIGNEAARLSGGSSVVRPDSARGILRRLAKLTAATSKRVVATPLVGRGRDYDDDKENARPGSDDGVKLKRPRMGLDIEDSLGDDEDSLLPVPDVGDDEEDSELPVAPTPSILPDDGDGGFNGHGDPTITFRSIDFARQARRDGENNGGRRISRLSFPVSEPLGDPDGGDDDPTILSEYGRRAISEEPTGRLSRYSFGSIRMDDFGSEPEIRRESDQERGKAKPMELMDDYFGIEMDDQDDQPLFYAEGTERLQNLQRSPSILPPDESTINIPRLDESFQLELPDTGAVALHANPDVPLRVSLDNSGIEVQKALVEENEPDALQSEHTGHLTTDSAPLRTSAPRRKKLKATRHGTMIPSLPSSLIKRVAIEAQARLGNRRPQLGRDHMKALEQATEWFFEQVGDDLEAYSDHARRKKRVDTSDVLMLMRRQRVLRGQGELAKAAKAVLPKEVLAELDIPDEL
ncbi:hypothetical protein LTR84_005409 [Exophiala bonariae]|uniref:CENP-T/Histone H4 histone fold domain-containing protein n=1 Tax=Exophiala bonariae TaxID=1690606 RepID=A0AAV9N7Y6_9EURO|nr:hypothetical protein LTR84_005409 [Exophiala bonariae]